MQTVMLSCHSALCGYTITDWEQLEIQTTLSDCTLTLLYAHMCRLCVLIHLLKCPLLTLAWVLLCSMRIHRDPGLTLVFGGRTMVPTPWFWHATISQTNARNVSRASWHELQFSAGCLSFGKHCCQSFPRNPAQSYCLPLSRYSSNYELWICNCYSTITTFIWILSHLIKCILKAENE